MPVNAPNDILDIDAPSFNLLNIDNNLVSLDEVRGKNGTVIAFICNHCPYVKAIITELVLTSIELKKNNIISIAIMPNDTVKYPQDSFENMKVFSKLHKFPFPYLLDYNQDVAKQFNAVCTPDFFGYNKNKELQYRGRLFEMKNLEIISEKNDLLDAMYLIAKTGNGPKNQISSAGCSIKWK